MLFLKLNQYLKGKPIDDLQFEVLSYKAMLRFKAFIKLRQLIESSVNIYSKVLEYNRNIVDVIFNIFSSTSTYDSLSPEHFDNQYFSEFSETLSQIYLNHNRVFEKLSDKFVKLIDQTKGWELHYIDGDKIRKDKNDTFKNFEYYNKKLTKLQQEKKQDIERISRNELKHLKAHSDYFAKSIKAYDYVKKLDNSVLEQSSQVLFGVLNLHKELHEETSKCIAIPTHLTDVYVKEFEEVILIY